jgi:hypothetical protein
MKGVDLCYVKVLRIVFFHVARVSCNKVYSLILKVNGMIKKSLE